jgi:hypothetical protein
MVVIFNNFAKRVRLLIMIYFDPYVAIVVGKCFFVWARCPDGERVVDLRNEKFQVALQDERNMRHEVNEHHTDGGFKKVRR